MKSRQLEHEPDVLLSAPPTISSKDVITALLDASKRVGQAVPIRTTFVQQGPRGRRRPGPLAGIVKARDELAFDLFLLVLLVASAPPHDVTKPSPMWLRAMDRDPASKSAASVLSRAWRRLADRRLVHRSRVARRASIRALREDGSGVAYTPPDGSDGEYYLKLPFAYWDEALYKRLTLPAKAMLLIALAERDGFSLPYERVPEWYGLSADTAQRGLSQLVELGIVHVAVGYKAAPLTAQGWTEDRQYTVDPKYRIGAVPESGRGNYSSDGPPIATPTRKPLKRTPKKRQASPSSKVARTARSSDERNRT